MQAVTSFTLLLLVASAAAVPAQPEQPQSSNSGEYLSPNCYRPPKSAPSSSHGQKLYRYNADPPLTSPEFSPEVSVSGQPQSVPVTGNSPASAASPSVGSSPVGESGSSAVVEQPAHHHPSVASYYAPAGLINVIGEQPGNKPVGPVRSFEQYGQPESASIPPNYKPFGSWGLYIGGNPADGYYTNYYKALGNSVDKQQSSEPVKPVPTSAFSPFLKQAGSSPYVGNDYYSFAYSPSDLRSGSNVPVEPVHSVPHTVPVSPVQAGAQVYGAPASFESNYGVSPYADTYATKRLGAAYAQKEATKEGPAAPLAPPKGYQSRVYVYPSVVAAPVGPLSAPVQSVQGGQQHVVAYPVPVGSQIVGSQPGVEGAFNPYGVHAFTRYAVKPTVVSHDPSYYYGVPNPNQVPTYKQQVYSGQSGPSYYPLSFYGYPLSQLHYSQGPSVPSAHNEPHHTPVQPSQFEAASEKNESEEKPFNKQQ